jgi:hypothetical protein
LLAILTLNAKAEDPGFQSYHLESERADLLGQGRWAKSSEENCDHPNHARKGSFHKAHYLDLSVVLEFTLSPLAKPLATESRWLLR